MNTKLTKIVLIIILVELDILLTSLLNLIIILNIIIKETNPLPLRIKLILMEEKLKLEDTMLVNILKLNRVPITTDILINQPLLTEQVTVDHYTTTSIRRVIINLCTQLITKQLTFPIPLILMTFL